MKKMIKRVTAWMLIITLVVPVGICIGAKEYVNATEDIAWGFFILSDGTACINGCSECTGRVVIPENLGYKVTGIGNNAFSGCSEMTDVVIPESITSIGNNAFSGCTGLSKITIPKNVTSIGSSVFSGCTGLTSLNVDLENKVFDSRGDCNAIIQKSSDTLIAGCVSTVIPEEIMSIGNYAFAGCIGLVDIEIPESVMSIGNNAFAGCTGLESITLSETVVSIGKNAFKDCSNLTIHAWRDSYAAAYAENNNIAIKYIGEPDATQAPDASAAPSASPSADVKPTQTPTKAPTQQPT